MTSFRGPLTLQRWKIADFRGQYDANFRNNGQISSNNFILTVQSSASFALFFKPTEFFKDSTFGVALKELDNKKSLEVGVKIWLENEGGQKFYEKSVQKKVFAKVGDEYKAQTSSGRNNQHDYNLFCNVYSKVKPLFVFCKITELNWRTTALELRREFHQNHWSAYENELHDAIVKIGETEFKVFKFPFITQSDVFAKMFNSGFKEGVTSTVEVKDVSEDTMQHLIKWLYTGQISDKTNVDELFKVADKYIIEVLKKTCAEIMLSTLDKGNAFVTFILGVIHNSDLLKNGALSLIDEMSSADCIKFTASSEWMEFSQKYKSAADEVYELIRQKLNIGGS